MDVSVVIPVYNERDNLRLLWQELHDALGPLGTDYEILLVDDGSTDGTSQIIAQLAAEDSHVRGIQLMKNFGQTAALRAGLDHAQGRVIVTLDGDLQNDPHDIPRLLDKLEEGYDLVQGWRQRRQDAWLSRKVPSKLANWLIARSSGSSFHDLGCTLRAMRHSTAVRLDLIGQMHRFIPILAAGSGARCCELVTRHRARMHGRTKYGIGRTGHVLLDLLTVWFLQRHLTGPLKLFGAIAGGCVLASAMLALGVGGWTAARGEAIPVFALAIACGGLLLTSVHFLAVGLVAELGARIYFTAQRPYVVRQVHEGAAREQGQPAVHTPSRRDSVPRWRAA